MTPTHLRVEDDPLRLYRWHVVAGVAIVIVYFLLPSDRLQAVWYVSAGAIGVVAVFAGVVIHRPRTRWPWYLLAAAVASELLGDLIYSTYEVLLRAEVPFPGPADAFYLLAYPLTAAGLWLLARRAGTTERSVLLDCSIIVVGVTLIVWRLVLRDSFGDDGVGVPGQLVAAAYPVGSLIALAFLVRLALNGQWANTSLWFLLLGTTAMLVSDIGAALLDGLWDGYESGHLIDVGWLLHFIFYGTAALHPRMRDVGGAPAVPENTRRRSLLLLVPVGLIVPVLALLPGEVSRLDTVVLAVTGAVLFILVIARISDLIAALNRTIVERSALARALREQAETDPLTGLPNRARFSTCIQNALHEGPVLVAFCDLDDFKSVNDGYGHLVGDELLVAVAGRLRGAVRADDLVVRLGGDEFAVLVSGTPSAAEIGERLVGAFHDAFALSSGLVRVGVSVGIATASKEASTSSLLSDADVAMYAAKRRGKNQFALFELGQRELVLGDADLVEALAYASSHEEFVVCYQPIVTVGEGRLVGLEALVRWERPGHGLLQPDAFLSAAEASRTIIDIDLFVLRTATADLAQWRSEVPALRVAVNLSGLSISSGRLSAEVVTALSSADLPLDALMLEITERVLVQDEKAAQRELDQLAVAGVTIALDDFGTGYSSLSYLQQFPVDILKLDARFIRAAGGNAESSALLRAAVRLGQTLGLQIIAEGVETEQQWSGLRELGCDFAQGYLFSPPLTAEQVKSLILGETGPVMLPVPAVRSRPFE